MNKNANIGPLNNGEIIYVTTGDQLMKEVALEVSKKISEALAHRDVTTRHSYLEQVKDAVNGKRMKVSQVVQGVVPEIVDEDEMELITRSAGGNWEQAR